MGSVSLEVIRHICGACTKLRTLIVRDCSRFNDQCLAFLARHAQKLTYLDITGCPRITEVGTESFLHTLSTSEVRQNRTDLTLELHMDEQETNWRTSNKRHSLW